MMNETVKRLAPKLETLRELFLKSGNLCAFPSCGHLMMDAEGVFIGQVCHIEAADQQGERFNPAMTNEERRQASNLMLMCYPHHQTTNNVAAYPVEKMRRMKADHEMRFSRPDRAIMERLIDWTAVDEPKGVLNLRRLNRALNWDHADEDLAEPVQELNALISRLRDVPVAVRQFLGAVALRAYKMKNTNAVQTQLMLGTKILISDLRGALRLSLKVLSDRTGELEAYSLGGFDEIETGQGSSPAIRIRELRSGWPLWMDLARFCAIEAESMETFTVDLNFSRLDD